MNFKNCREAVSRYTKKWARDADVDRRVLRDWKEMVVDSVQRRISYLRQRHINKRKKHVLKNKVHLNNLEYMHENLVLVLADKALNNVIIVCKKYYLDVVIRELSSTSTYQEVRRSCDDIVLRHIKYMEHNGIVLQSEHETLPSFYRLPKLHKSPFGKRFIAASNKCTTKRLSTLLTACFKTTLTLYKQYCEEIYKRSGVNCFWVIENSLEVLEKLRRINKTSEARCFETYDFATLYTSVPHDMLKSSIRTLVREAYKDRGAKYLVIDRLNRAHWSEVP